VLVATRAEYIPIGIHWQNSIQTDIEQINRPFWHLGHQMRSTGQHDQITAFEIQAFQITAPRKPCAIVTKRRDDSEINISS
jgi:hypothetical protein